MGAFASFLRFSKMPCNYPRGLVRDPKGQEYFFWIGFC